MPGREAGTRVYVFARVCVKDREGVRVRIHTTHMIYSHGSAEGENMPGWAAGKGMIGDMVHRCLCYITTS